MRSPNTDFFPTAKGVIGQRHRNWHVDAYHAHIDAVRKVTRGVAITGENGGAVTIFVIHGKADPLVRPVAAEQLGYLLPHARVEMIDGMGHDLPEPLLSRFAEIGFETMAQQPWQDNS